MDNKKVQGFGVRFANFIKKTDAFGTPVSFTYKNETCIKSFVGGFFTSLARFGVGIYLLLQCLNVLHREKIVQTTILKRDLTKDDTEDHYTLSNFDFAYRLEYQFYEDHPDIQENLDQYVYLGVTGNTYTWASDSAGNPVQKKEKQTYTVGSCQNGRLGLAEGGADYLGLKSGYYCPGEIDFKMKGSFAGEQAKFVQIRLGFCNQTYLNVKYNNNKKCKDMASQIDVAGNIKLYYVVQNSYFDTEDFSENPIKKYLKPYYLTTKNYTSLYYYMLLSKNKAKYNDGMLFGTPAETEFVETRIDYAVTQEVPTQDSTPNAFISIYIQMDDTYKVVGRTVTTFVTALQATGGFMTIIFVVTTMIVNRFQKTIYYTSLIRSFYKYQKPKQAEGEEQLESSDEDEKKKVTDTDKDTAEINKKFQFKDKFKDSKEYLFNRLLGQIGDRKKLLMGLWAVVVNRMKHVFCKKLNRRQKFRELLYQRGVIKIEKELDIRTISKQLKTLKFISQVMLTKYQRFMISQFKENLLNHKQIKDKIVKKDMEKQLQKNLYKMIVNCESSKMDQRIIRNVDLSEDDELLKQLTDNVAKPEQSMDRISMNKSKRRRNSRSYEVKIGGDKETKKGSNIDDLIMKQSMKSMKIFEDDDGPSKKTLK